MPFQSIFGVSFHEVRYRKWDPTDCASCCDAVSSVNKKQYRPVRWTLPRANQFILSSLTKRAKVSAEPGYELAKAFVSTIQMSINLSRKEIDNETNLQPNFLTSKYGRQYEPKLDQSANIITILDHI